MNNFMELVSIQVVLFIYILVGVYAKKKGIITKDNQQKFIDFILHILMPCMIFNSFKQELTLQVIKSAWTIMTISFGIALVALVLGKIVYWRFPDNKKSIMQYGTIVNNSGFAGLPLVGEIFGEAGLFYASFFLIPNRIFMWSAGISLFEKTDRKTKWKNVLLNPNIIAVELGLIRGLLALELPYSINYAIEKMGNSVAPLSMIIVGAILADVNLRNIFDKSVFLVTLIRLIVLPLVATGIISLLRLDAMISGVALVLTGMPVGTTTALLAAKYNADVEFASKLVFITTLLSLITAPVLILLI